jgi:hypothetical protein
MPANLASKTVRDYVCSTCWGSLETEPQHGSPNWVVCCSTCDETRGFVSRYYTDERRTQDHFDALEVKKLLQDLEIIDRPPKKTEGQILEELGF